MRQCAARLLGAVIEKKTSLDGLTDNQHGHPQYLALDERDRALVRAISGAALRHRGTIDALLAQLLDRPLPENAVALKALLHIAAAQILYLDIPDHSAVDLAVTAANEDPRNRRYAGLVNAVLRRLSRDKDELFAQFAPHPYPLPASGARGTSTLPLSPSPRSSRGEGAGRRMRGIQRPSTSASNAPAWFAANLVEAYGAEKAAAILAMHAVEPPVDLTVKSDPQGWAERLGGIVLPNGTVRLARLDGALTELPGFAEGEWWVQDAAASLPARLFGDIAGKRVADLCAAPGGKTAQLALAGADVTAVEISANRLARLRSNLERLKLHAHTVEANLMQYRPEEKFDAVLLDAPCSSTGTVRRHPDVPWTKSPEDIAKLAALQAQFLARTVELVKPGGVIVFSNCSLDPSEGEAVARSALANPALQAFPVAEDEIPGLHGLITPEGFLRSTPQDFPHPDPRLAGMDGFFAARFRRVSA